MDKNIRTIMLTAYLNGGKIDDISNIPEDIRDKLSTYGVFYSDLIKERSYALNDKGIAYCENIINVKSSRKWGLFKDVIVAVGGAVVGAVVAYYLK